MNDLIRKYDVLKICSEQIWNGADDYYPISANQIAKKVKELPTVDAVHVRHGKWIYGNEFHWYTASCSRCGYKRTTDIKAANWNAWKYCPNCGARMDEE